MKQQPRAGLLTTADYAKCQLFRSADGELNWRAWNTITGTLTALERDAQHSVRVPSYAQYSYAALGYDSVRLLGTIELLRMPLVDLRALRKVPYKKRNQQVRVMVLQAEIKKIREAYKLLPKLQAELKVEEAALAAMRP